jgi:putative phage-type endonuclease
MAEDVNLALIPRSDAWKKRRQRWLQERRKGIGGSDAPVVVGLYGSPLKIWAEKVGLGEPDEAESERQYWGKVLETPIAARFKAENPRIKVAVPKKPSIHPKYGFVRANLDREIFCPDRGPGVLEIKTAHELKVDAWENDAPDGYRIQLQHQLMASGREWGVIAALVGFGKYIEYTYEIDLDLCSMILEKEAEFWDYVERQEMPPVTEGSEQTTKFLRSLYYREKTGSILPMPEHFIPLLDEREMHMAEIKSHEERKKAIENMVRALIQENEMVMGGGWKARWYETITNRVEDMNVLKEKHPDAFDECVVGVSSRRLDIRRVKEK